MVGEEPARRKPGPRLSAKMSTLARRNTRPEVLLRRELHRRGLRFRLQYRVPGDRRRTIDVALTRARIAIYVDGCFWHGCPEHLHLPKANREWWSWKLSNNRARDRDTDRQLREADWTVMRAWEHEDPVAVADRIELLWRSATDRGL